MHRWTISACSNIVCSFLAIRNFLKYCTMEHRRINQPLCSGAMLLKNCTIFSPGGAPLDYISAAWMLCLAENNDCAVNIVVSRATARQRIHFPRRNIVLFTFCYLLDIHCKHTYKHCESAAPQDLQHIYCCKSIVFYLLAQYVFLEVRSNYCTILHVLHMFCCLTFTEMFFE